MNKTFAVIRGMAILTITLFLTISAAAQDDKKYQELAVRLVQSASVKPGDVVMINGGKHLIPLMEAVAVEVQKAGGFANMMLNIDRVQRSFYKEMPEKYLEQEPRFFAEWLKQTNVYISLPNFEDSKSVFEGIPEERFAKAMKAGEFFSNLINSLPLRVISIDFPTPQDAAAVGMDFPTYQKITMDGINADYNTISAKGSQFRKILETAKQIRITNPAGSDFTFSPAAKREIFLDDGIVTAEEAKSSIFIQRTASLPAGSINFAPLETSANGKIVGAKAVCRYAPMDGVSFEFKNGAMQNFKAETNAACYQETMKAYTNPDKERFATISFGLNPALPVVEEGTKRHRPASAAGMVWLSVGDNQIYGGTNNGGNSYNFPVINATVTIDGKIVIKDGKLML
ncbi:MAG: aminopeptidase [Pyrinomonadaceae bacterium]|nr:aminopeptidase [Pyrinomonadaceae bacterium]